ncbi:hypothetical protein LguiA_015322 [Lonicera macranthoides]
MGLSISPIVHFETKTISKIKPTGLYFKCKCNPSLSKTYNIYPTRLDIENLITGLDLEYNLDTPKL